MIDKLWKRIANVVAKPAVADYLIGRSFRTPYFHLDGYMHRWWLFNPTPHQNDGKGRKFEWLPSIRIHHILRPDNRPEPHNHPWDARTIILRGRYTEEREGLLYVRQRGDTAKIDADTFHNIINVSPGGVWTLFISWKYQHSWGFKKADGTVVPWREFLGIKEKS